MEKLLNQIFVNISNNADGQDEIRFFQVAQVNAENITVLNELQAVAKTETQGSYSCLSLTPSSEIIGKFTDSHIDLNNEDTISVIGMVCNKFDGCAISYCP